MKEVMKHQQPHIQPNMIVEQSAAKGLRPILPKPADNVLTASPFLNNTATSGVEILTDGNVSTLPRSIPVVILPTQMYMNMANKIAAQAAAGNMEAVGLNPTFVPIANDSVRVESTGIDQQGSGELGQQNDCSLTGKVAGEVGSESSIFFTGEVVNEIRQKNVSNETTKQMVHNDKNTESEKISEHSGTQMDESSNCKPNSNNGYWLVNDDKKEANDLMAPCTKKTRTDKRKTKPVHRKISTPSIQNKQNFRQPTRSPLRPCPQPTLAAINSQANELTTSPGGILHRQNASDLTSVSPIKPMITPTKACGNQSFLSSLLVSPLGLSTLGYSGLTPLNYGSDSGIFTPLKEGEMDFGFLFSPERFGSIKTCSTPQSCRKSLRLGLTNRADDKKSDSRYSSYDVDFSKL